MQGLQILVGDCIEQMRTLPDGAAHTCVTSPPYFGLRDYGHDGQRGLEATPDLFVEGLVDVFREVRRVLRDDGTLWLNIGDSYASLGRSKRRESPGVGAVQHMRPVDRTIEWEKRPPGSKNASFGWRLPGGIKPKDLIGIPWMLAFALRADGWYLRQDIIWHKPNAMPESVGDRCTKAHEYLFLLSKSERYFFNSEAIQERAIHHGRVVKTTGSKAKVMADGGKVERRTARGFTDHDNVVTGRNKRSVWTVPTRAYVGAHFATFPPRLITPCILAGCPEGGTVIDPFAGSGTTGQVALEHNREAILCEINPVFVPLIHKRCNGLQRRLLS